MRLYLVQHGEAVPEEADPARPLSAGGQTDVARIAGFLAAAGVHVGRIVHSGKRRAEQTAEILAAAQGPGSTPQARLGLNPNDPTDSVAREAAAWDEDVMLVGHLPFMARLASRLVAGREDAGVVAFQPGSVLCLERVDRQRWSISLDGAAAPAAERSLMDRSLLPRAPIASEQVVTGDPLSLCCGW